MASLVTNLLGGGLLNGVSNLISVIKGKNPGDAEKLAELAGKYQSDILAADQAAMQAQTDVNKAEAASSDKFTSRWRPCIGYVCAAAFAINYVVGPLASWVGHISGVAIDFPPMNMGELMPVLLGMLGLGGMRTFEKVNKVA